MTFGDNKLSLGQRSTMLGVFKDYQNRGNLKMFDLSKTDEVWEWLGKIDEDMRKKIYNLIDRKKFASLNKTLMYSKFPLIPTDEQLKILKENGYKTFRDAKDAGVIA